MATWWLKFETLWGRGIFRSEATVFAIAAVATAFPSGRASLPVKILDTEFAVAEGADEIDMVIDRGAFLQGAWGVVYDQIVAVKEACARPDGTYAHLKVILETGELATLDNVRRASWLAILAGADFIKTSTGKVCSSSDTSGDGHDVGSDPRLVCPHGRKDWDETSGRDSGQ